MFDSLHTQKHIHTYYNTQTHRLTDTDTQTQAPRHTDTHRHRYRLSKVLVHSANGFGERLTADVAVEDAETASVRLWTGWFVIRALYVRFKYYCRDSLSKKIGVTNSEKQKTFLFFFFDFSEILFQKISKSCPSGN